MRLVFAFHGVVFFGMIWITVVQSKRSRKRKSKQSQEAQLLNIPKPGDENCQKLMKGLVPGKNEFKTQCSPYIANNRYPPCSCWCNIFASYLNVTQTQKWLKGCSRTFRTATQRFLLSNEKNGNSSSLTKIHITRCRPIRRCLFIINIGECRCSPVNKDHVIEQYPCSTDNNRKQHWGWKLSVKKTISSQVIPKCEPEESASPYQAFFECFRKFEKDATCMKNIRYDFPQGKKDNFTIFVGGDRIFNNTWKMWSLFKISGKLDSNSRRSGAESAVLHFKIVKNCSCDDITINQEENNISLPEKSVEKLFRSIDEEIDDDEGNALQRAKAFLRTAIEEFKHVKQVYATDEELEENAHFTAIAFEDSVVRIVENQLISNISQFNNKNLQIRRVFYQNETDFHLNETEGNMIKLPAENFAVNDSVLGVIYKDLHDLFIKERTKYQDTKRNRRINTVIMSAAVYPRSGKLQKNVTMVFKNIKPAGQKRECVFWNYSENNSEGWSGEGCYASSITSSETVCVCSHLTHFAVLMDFTDTGSELPPDEIKILNILTYVGLTLSLLGDVITIICYLLLADKKSPLCQIRVSLVASLLAGQITFLAGIDVTKNKGACVTVAAVMQYLFMAALCWMLVEGIYLYLFVVKVYNVNHRMYVYHGMSWGIPAVLVTISLTIAAGTDGIESFVNDEHCWLSSTNRPIWILFLSFVLLIQLVNVVILVRVIKEVASMQHAEDNQTAQIKLGIRACVVLIPLLGVTWLFGLLSPLHKTFLYIFVILNSTQGFFIFILHCVRNSELRARFVKRIQVHGGIEDNRVRKPSDGNRNTLNEVDVDPGNIIELEG